MRARFREGFLNLLPCSDTPTTNYQLPYPTLMAKAFLLSNTWYGQPIHPGMAYSFQHWLAHSSSTFPKFSHWQKMDMKVNAVASSDSDAKKANLFVAKKERIKLPTYDDGLGDKKYHISEFLSHPCGIAAVLNTRALQSFQSLDTNTYRCVLPKLQFLNFEVAPLLDLRVTSTDEDCLVEMLSCKFEGSEVVEEQNNHFSAFMINHMTWGGDDDESFLEVDVKLNLTLEVICSRFHVVVFSDDMELPKNDASFSRQARATAASADDARLRRMGSKSMRKYSINMDSS